MGGVTLTIRRYQCADAAATARVFRESVSRTAAASYEDRQIAAWLGRGNDVRRWNTRRLAAHTVVAETQGEVAGFSDLTRAGVLDMLYVHPDHAGQGVARALVEEVLGEARSRGLATVVVQASRAARPVLERLGFVVDHENPHNVVDGVCVPNFTMHADLEPC
ncbi:MAG: GNAT family N-acetyltransferase [Micrococcales bacterium]|nr:MAG: GNAT family N-acetyltransferase [Micrococcales bacterium]